MSLRMKIRSEQDLAGRNPCCSSLRCESRAALRHCSITEASILLGIDVKLMPLQLSQISASPFLKSLTSIPLVQSFGTFSLFQMATRRAVHTKYVGSKGHFQHLCRDPIHSRCTSIFQVFHSCRPFFRAGWVSTYVNL